MTNKHKTQRNSEAENGSYISKIHEMPYRMRILLVIFVISSLMIHNYLSFYSRDIAHELGTCNIDYVLESTESLNRYIHENSTFRKIVVTISSLLIDISTTSMICVWVSKSTTWRPVLTIAIFYALRGICNTIFLMKYPTNLLWEHPGFPSMSVSYHSTSDFFFSGHVGINLICAIELSKMSYKRLSYISYSGIFFQIFTMIAVRGHYSVDLIAGLIAGHYCNMAATQMCEYIDNILNFDHDVESFFNSGTEATANGKKALKTNSVEEKEINMETVIADDLLSKETFITGQN